MFDVIIWIDNFQFSILGVVNFKVHPNYSPRARGVYNSAIFDLNERLGMSGL